ncbi:type IX secretion system anionic LPS delivery protein PorZ [Leeuwenhoekiella palythoae]|uniref:Por secretion system C-terminal sorting domain-containing protein n=1 Tax=Leeuwenhoekiella palythoae TaxID=573501 RepID=A0A1M5W7F8_9FLAO|nr:T9SS type A sorting domain-containing protein [Leeuwenhoekiella palythoae]RXG31236.1 putative secreted protein (Por secretion system target) [Leeuwenhoekiella palythoae]SHH83417.1 Por secretion system C-terminal sorting domain-containing protein [Leeuwenhoekiella palythoae]
MFKKNPYLLLFLLNICCVFAQEYSEAWTAYFSYNQITALAEGNDKIFAAAQNSVFSYDLNTNETQLYSTIQGLSGEAISAIHFSEATGILFVGYTSGLIDVVMPDESVTTLVAIRDKPAILPSEKMINSFDEHNNTLYIATGFGISLFDLSRLEFDDSYFIGNNGARLNIKQTAILEEYIYAASPNGGLRRALKADDNLIDFQNWETLDPTGWEGIQTFAEALWGVKSDQSLQRFDGANFNTQTTLDRLPVSFLASEDALTISLDSQILIYDASGNLTTTVAALADYPGSYTSAFTSQGQIYLGTDANGLLISSTANTTAALQVLPDGPLRNDPFSIEAAPGQLWVAYGDYSDTYNPFPLKQRGLSHFVVDSGWYNLPFESLLETNSITNITYNPEDNAQVFMSSFNAGLLEIIEEVPLQLYDETNSGLSDIPFAPTDVRINGAAFDRNGTLWMTNSLVENALARKTGNQIDGISIASILPDFDAVNGYSELVIGRLGNIYFGSSNRGLIGYDPDANSFRLLNAERSNLPSDNVQSLAVDNNGALWIGTSLGLRRLFSPAQMFENAEIQTQPIIIEESGSTVELLNDQVIRAIAVDGNNNKWVGTVSSGVFYFSANGQETLQQFSTTNSPLPSNNIQDISIDEESGEVFFATPLGLVSFSGSAVAPKETLENARVFPNPVRPSFTGSVTIDGLTENANVKITDLNGNLVYEEVSEGGSIQWDTTAFGRYRVASGVYFILITAEDAVETKIVKLMIIR